MLFSRLSLTDLPPAPSAMLPQAPQHLPVPQHSSCKFLFFLVVLHLLTLVSKRYLQLLLCPIPLCHVPTLRQHHPLHTSSTPLLASFGCINASVTTPVCPQLNVSFFFYHFAFANSCFVVPSCHIPFLMPCLFSHATSPPLCHIPSLMPPPLPHAASFPSCCIHSLILCPLPHAVSALLCHVHSLVPHLHPHLCCINPPSPGLSQLHRHPDLCAPCWMPLSSLIPLHYMLYSACVVPPPPPTPLPCLMHASVHVPV